MYIKNATYKTVPTGSLSFPLAEGAVVTAGGVTGIVPENVAAAGPTAQIYVAVGGTIDLTSEANKGVSFTDAQIKALGSDFNFVPASEKEIPTPTLADAGKVVAVNETGTEYELVEAGGLNIPDPSADNYGSSVVVDKKAVPDAAIVPPQLITATWSEEDELWIWSLPADTNPSLFVDGSTVVMRLENIDYSAKIIGGAAYNDVISFYSEDDDINCWFALSEEEQEAKEPVSKTVALYQAVWQYEYGADKFPEYDYVFRCSGSSFSGSPDDWEIVKASYDRVMSKFQNGEPITALAYRMHKAEAEDFNDSTEILPLVSVGRVGDIFENLLFTFMLLSTNNYTASSSITIVRTLLRVTVYVGDTIGDVDKTTNSKLLS